MRSRKLAYDAAQSSTSIPKPSGAPVRHSASGSTSIPGPSVPFRMLKPAELRTAGAIGGAGASALDGVLVGEPAVRRGESRSSSSSREASIFDGEIARVRVASLDFKRSRARVSSPPTDPPKSSHFEFTRSAGTDGAERDRTLLLLATHSLAFAPLWGARRRAAGYTDHTGVAARALRSGGLSTARTSHVTGHAPDPSGYAHSPITLPRLQPLIEIPKALARSAANASSSTHLAVARRRRRPDQLRRRRRTCSCEVEESSWSSEIAVWRSPSPCVPRACSLPGLQAIAVTAHHATMSTRNLKQRTVAAAAIAAGAAVRGRHGGGPDPRRVAQEHDGGGGVGVRARA